MANEEHLRILKQGTHAWNEWRHKFPDIQPDLTGADICKDYFPVTDFAGADLTGAQFRETNLKYSSFNGAKMSSANFHEAYLHGAELNSVMAQGAKFSSAILSRTDFSKADLNGATLLGADLEGARLIGTNLKGANLYGANLSAANLAGANFEGAEIAMTLFGDVDLSEVKRLESVRHLGPSSIGIDTIYRSGGNIPEVFLHGAGVPEPFIANVKALVGAMSPVEFYSCFISYSHADKTFARMLHDALHRHGIRCWLDEHQLLPGDDIYREVDRGIRLWDKMLLCCSENSLESWWVDNEIRTAFEKEQQLMKDRGDKVQVLVPLNLDGYLFGDGCKSKHGYQAQIRGRLAADFTEMGADAVKFESQVAKLIRALRADADAREKPPKQKL